MEQRITLLPDQEIKLDLPLSGYRLIPGYTGRFGLPIEIFLCLYAAKDEVKRLIAGPDDLSTLIEQIDDEAAAWRSLRLFTAPATHYLFQKGVYTIDLEVAAPGSPVTEGMVSPETAQRIGYQPPEIKLENDAYLTGRDLIRADSVNRLAPVEVFRRFESRSREGNYRFIEDKVKGAIGRQEVAFPSYE